MTPPALELWGGIECTVNRVGDRYHDQLHFSGHHARTSDLQKLASLGLKALRYPVLWEHAAPGSLDELDFGWADERLSLLRELGVELVAQAIHQMYLMANNAGHGDQFVPTMVDVVEAWNRK